MLTLFLLWVRTWPRITRSAFRGGWKRKSVEQKSFTFSRPSAVSDIWAPLRAGSDVLFLGGLVNYVLQNDKDFREYVVNYTNASVIIGEDFKDTEDLDGLFSGWDPERSVYDTRTWTYDKCAKEEAPSQNLAHG